MFELLKRIAGWNIAVLLTYTLLVNLIVSTANEGELVKLIYLAVLIVVQVGINLLASLFTTMSETKGLARAYLASAGIVLVLGFSTCFGSIALFQKF